MQDVDNMTELYNSYNYTELVDFLTQITSTTLHSGPNTVAPSVVGW